VKRCQQKLNQANRTSLDVDQHSDEFLAVRRAAQVSLVLLDPGCWNGCSFAGPLKDGFSDCCGARTNAAAAEL
jgi:hypothetical protein